MKYTQGAGFSQIIQLGRRDRGLTSSTLICKRLQEDGIQGEVIESSMSRN